jgi:hypothetical protein
MVTKNAAEAAALYISKEYIFPRFRNYCVGVFAWKKNVHETRWDELAGEEGSFNSEPVTRVGAK